MDTDLEKAFEAALVDAGLTQKEVADRAQLTTETLRLIRRGRTRPKPLTMRRLEVALGKPRGWLAGLLSGDRTVVKEVGPMPVVAAMRDRVTEAIVQLDARQLAEVDAFVDWILTLSGDGDHSSTAGETGQD